MIEVHKNEKRQELKRTQNIIMESRERLAITGVLNVDNFNEELVVLDTDLGMLEIKGEGLHISKLNLDNEVGEISIDGYVISCEYFDEEYNKGQGLLSRLFK